MAGDSAGPGAFGGLNLRDVCDITHHLLRGRVERQALGDRQALLTAAALNGAEEYTPVNPEAAVSGWEAWLAQDPNDTPEARAAELERRIMEAR